MRHARDSESYQQLSKPRRDVRQGGIAAHVQDLQGGGKRALARESADAIVCGKPSQTGEQDH
eukprot:3115252-Rhodomonas_salina.1